MLEHAAHNDQILLTVVLAAASAAVILSKGQEHAETKARKRG